MYKYFRIEDENPLFYFKTKLGYTYTVSFTLESFGNSYFQYLSILDFSELEGRKSPKDDKISATIIQIIDDYFNQNPETIIHYVCDSTDGYHRSRSRLFSMWFKNYDRNKINKLKIEHSNQSLEFLYDSSLYDTDVLQEQVLEQMNIFSEHK